MIRALSVLIMSVLSFLLFASRPAQGQIETLYDFQGGSDGINPTAGLTLDSEGNIYGTTSGGGLGFGTVFELSPISGGPWNETVLYSFTGGADGSTPNGSLVFNGGKLYGAAEGGGANSGAGVVFEIVPEGAASTENVLYNFCSQNSQGACLDGSHPTNGLVMDAMGNLYGTAYGGTIFELSPSGSGWAEQVIYNNVSAGIPNGAGLTMDEAGDIFGIEGVISDEYSFSVFELSRNGSGGWSPTTLHTFFVGKGEDSRSNCRQSCPDQHGNLYGTVTYSDRRDGIVYQLSPGKNGKWVEKLIYTFIRPELFPLRGQLLDASGNIYGSTRASRKEGATVYELVNPGGSGKYQLKGFSLVGPDPFGRDPWDNMIKDNSGNIYGTTESGGSDSACGSGWDSIQDSAIRHGDRDCAYVWTESVHLWSGGDLYRGRYSCSIEWRSRIVYGRHNGVGNGIANRRFS